MSLAMAHTNTIDVSGVLAGSGQQLLIEDQIALAPFEGIEFPQPVRTRLEVRCIDRLLQIEGTIEAVVRGACDACLEDVERAMRVDVQERLNPAENRESEPFGDSNVLTGNRLDVEDLTQQLLLCAMPLGLRCSDDCKGLCGTCGTNLNASICSCNDGDHRGKSEVEDPAQ
jgi:uncharacterized protein